jgi:hypothetical protein
MLSAAGRRNDRPLMAAKPSPDGLALAIAHLRIERTTT